MMRIMNFILLFIENCLQNDKIHYFSVWLRTGSQSYPADINQFKAILEYKLLLPVTGINSLHLSGN